ncbi:MAG TPA: peroxiredoxin [Aggregatilineales bacterium]|nr:peroxiredoxin [Aggregatilineales bacterium]
MPQVGEPAPDFEMVNDEGKRVKLSDYRGQTVILYFYPKDFTSGCELQACRFRDEYSKIAAKNALVLGVSADDADSHRKFREALNLPFHLLVDSDLSNIKAWNAYGEKKRPNGETYMGIVRSQYVIDPAGKIIDVQNPVTPADSANLALKTIGAA